ncbi:hypothetical protein F444_01468 [Phytophthora nicotianae P1976]|uniref:HTH CENPB-type domain-containing protein n=1 Tax=Phytophthora nicotianae P1976 TaxID=1317066 RepID=A0A081B0I0_PHYNI|nr:hypothetical protein F444_01468 [Phytophthora nicotianae P1976]
MPSTPSPKKVMARTPGQQQGRTRTTGAGKLPKQFKRVALLFRHKLDVIEFYDAIISKEKMHATISYFYPSLAAYKVKVKKRQVCNWLNQRALIIDKCETGCGSHCKERKFGRSATLSPEFEEQLVLWINSLRKEGVPVTGIMIRIHTRDCYESAGLSEGKFTASQTWLLSFLSL